MSATYTGYRSSTYVSARDAREGTSGWSVKRNLTTGLCEVYDPQDRLVAQRRRWWSAMSVALRAALGEAVPTCA